MIGFSEVFISLKWIKCSESLPENNQYVLAFDGLDFYLLKFNERLDRRFKKRQGYFSSSYDDDFFDEITHWMQLPEFPVDPT